MNQYLCVCRGLEVVVYADTSYQAQKLAYFEFKKNAGRRAIKQHEVVVWLAKVGEKEVVHTADF